MKFAEQQLSAGVLPTPDPSLAVRGKTFTKADWNPQMLRVVYKEFQDKVIRDFLFGYLGPCTAPKLIKLGDLQDFDGEHKLVRQNN